MGRTFGGSPDEVVLGQPTNVTFDENNDWTCFVTFKVDTLVNPGHIIAKATGTAGTRQIQLQTADSTGLAIRLRNNNTTRWTSTNVSTGVWLLAVIIGDGTTTNADIYLYNMETKVLVDSSTGLTWTDAGVNNRDVALGGRNGTQYFEGDIGHFGYIHNLKLDANERVRLMFDPRSVIAQFGAEVYYELGTGSPEPDLSGTGNNGTVTGTTGTSVFPTGRPPQMVAGIPVAAAAGVSIPVVMHNYRRRRVLCG